MKKFFKISLRIFLTFLAIVITTEILLQTEFFLTSSADQKAHQKYHQAVMERVYRGWLSMEETDPFSPPFLVFSNKNSSDAERLKNIFDTTRLAPQQTWTSSDFLQAPERASSTQYTIHSNTLGFRGEERTREKPLGVYRIVVLGSYDAFGHGVNDNETYSAQLEKKLNETHPNSFEVWNGGRHAGTAIVGLARMTYEIFEYAPDLIILDYGSIDTAVFDDNLFPLALRFPDTPLFLVVRKTLIPVVSLLNESEVFRRIANTYFLNKQEPVRVTQFTETLETMVSLAEEHHVPVLLVRQPSSLPPPLFESLTSSTVFFADVNTFFKKNPPVYPPVSSWTTGYWTSTWLAEVEPHWLANLVNKNTAFYPYKLNYLRLNSRGQKVIADELADFIQKNILIHQ